MILLNRTIALSQLPSQVSAWNRNPLLSLPKLLEIVLFSIRVWCVVDDDSAKDNSPWQLPPCPPWTVTAPCGGDPATVITVSLTLETIVYLVLAPLNLTHMPGASFQNCHPF